LRSFLSVLGPGFTAGAADNDPSGIATYSIAGAQLGTSVLWAPLFMWPLMGFVVFTTARIGMLTGRGLAGALRLKYPCWVPAIAAAALLCANVATIGADLAGMSDAAQMLSGVNSRLFTIVFGIGIMLVIVKFRYHQIALVLKWLALALFAYVIAAFILKPNWWSILHDTIIPSWPREHNPSQILVAMFGAMLSPYLFFWQASQEVEEKKAVGRRLPVAREGASKRELINRQVDVGLGSSFSILVIYFIVLTTALTLHAHRMTDIHSSQQIAEALQPVAGAMASTLYTIGLVGTGLLAIPVLAGSSAYAFAETFVWKEGLDRPVASAPYFYGLIAASTLLGIALVFFGINPIEALFLASVINGVLAPFLLIGILLISCDRKLMQGKPSSWAARIVVAITAALMLLAAGAMSLG
jgi:Mn2+/Fe2+ NRAMP family transporter